MRRVISELRRRGVIKAAGAYLVGGFGLIQAADLALPRLGAPDWIVTGLLVALLAGFPLVCIVAWYYDLGRDGFTRTPPVGPRWRVASRAALLGGGVAVVALLGIVGWTLIGGGRPDAPLRNDLLAIAPFRVTGDVAYLEEGMLDLLAAKLTGEGGLRAVEPRALLAAWRQAGSGSPADAQQVAHGLGAGRLLLGSVVAAGDRLVLGGRIVDTADGNLLASFETPGELSALPELVDRFAGGLLAQLAGVDQDRLRTLEATPFPAIRAYLDGQQLLRAGRFLEAKTAFGEAQQIDSTFALPGVFHAVAAGFTAQQTTAGAELAWRHRDRLSPRDQMLLHGVLGTGSGTVARIRQLQELTELSPDRAEAWYLRGDFVYHYDLRTPLPERLVRAAGHFATATTLDDRFGPADLHLLELAIILRGDSAAARRHARSVLAFSPEGDLAAYTRWYLDRLEGYPQQPMDDTQPFVMMRMFAGLMAAQLNLGLDAADELVEWGVRTALDADRFMLNEAVLYMLNRGRPGRADEIARARSLGPPVSGPIARVYRALYWETGEDLASLQPVALRLAEAARGKRSADGTDWRQAACVAGQYGSATGNTGLVADMEQRLAEAADTSVEGRHANLCGLLLSVRQAAAGAPLQDATGAVLQDAAGAPLQDAPQRLDDALAAGDVGEPWLRDAGTLVLADFYERMGDPARALDVIRRRTFAIPGARFLSTQLRVESRLAAAVGRQDEAHDAAAHYLALRAEPEPSVRRIVEAVRQESRRR